MLLNLPLSAFLNHEEPMYHVGYMTPHEDHEEKKPKKKDFFHHGAMENKEKTSFYIKEKG